jgi:hypothetical protein
MRRLGAGHQVRSRTRLAPSLARSTSVERHSDICPHTDAYRTMLQPESASLVTFAFEALPGATPFGLKETAWERAPSQQHNTQGPQHRSCRLASVLHLAAAHLHHLSARTACACGSSSYTACAATREAQRPKAGAQAHVRRSPAPCLQRCPASQASDQRRQALPAASCTVCRQSHMVRMPWRRHPCCALYLTGACAQGEAKEGMTMKHDDTLYYAQPRARTTAATSWGTPLAGYPAKSTGVSCSCSWLRACALLQALPMGAPGCTSS